jgi:hypothetical protein
MKIQIYDDELYPFYSVLLTNHKNFPEIEVPEADVARWESAGVAFRVAQSEMSELSNKAWVEFHNLKKLSAGG